MFGIGMLYFVFWGYMNEIGGLYVKLNKLDIEVGIILCYLRGI